VIEEDSWFIKNHIELARYVHPEVARWFRLNVSRHDLFGEPKEIHRQLIRAIYDTLLEKKISYDPPLYNPSSKHQKIRNPNEILAGNQTGTCLDLALLFSSLCLGNDLLPVIIVLKGHALVAVSLEHRRNESRYRPDRRWFAEEPLTDEAAFRAFIDRIDEGAYLVIECTGFVRSEMLSRMQDERYPESMQRVNGVLSFDQASLAGRKQLDSESRPFQFALDVAIAHEEWKLTPQPLPPSPWEDLLSLGVDLVLPLADIPHASDEDVRGYYKGNLLKWNILAAQGDVKRDISDTLIQSLTSSKNRVTMLCLSGEPGAGKSTLAWRVAAEVVRSLDRPLLHILNNEAEVWYKLRRLAQQSQMPLVVLVDDVFRDPNARRALAFLRPDQDIIIIATSRSNEIPENLRLPFLLLLQTLEEPTPTEKRRVLQKLGLDENSLGGPQRERLRNVNSWLIFMSEISTGEEWKKIVGDSVDRLKEQDNDKVVYRAYEYLCYAGQYDLAVPEMLIAALDDHGHFYNLPEHPISKGLIFHDSRISQNNIRIQDRLRTRHPIFAREALKFYRRDPLAILKDFVNAARSDQRAHRIFLCVLLYSSFVLDTQESVIQNLLDQQKTAIDAILAASNSSELLYYWLVLYRMLGDHKKIKEIEAIALSRPPQEPIDWLAHFGLIERRGTQEQIDKLISDANGWLAANPQDHDVRGAYLRLVEKKGDPEQIQAAIASTIEWLAMPVNPQDAEVRKTLLSLLKREFNDSKLIQAVTASTIEWLAMPVNRQDVEVRKTLLGLVEFKGADRKQIESVINSTGAWLANNPQDVEVRKTYLGTVERKGTSKQATEAITATIDWLDKNPKIDWLVNIPQDHEIRKAYLGLVERRGTPTQITDVISSTGIWLANNPQDVEVRKTYLGLVERKGNDREQIRAVITATTDWLTDNPQDHDVRRTYLGLVKRRGTEEQIKAVITATIEWLAMPENRQDVEVRRAYLGLVEQQGEPEQITDVINSTGSWLADHPQDHEVLGTYLGLVERQGDRKQLALACNLAKKWLDHNPMTRRRSYQYMWMLKGYERVLSKLERYQEKEQ